jgi:murein DD-endopeptidase MepM/ murein hydrolase activator NlpD
LSRTVRLGAGDTLGGLLADAGASRKEAAEAAAAFGRVFDPRRLRTGLEVTLTLSPPCCVPDEGGDGRTLRLLGFALDPDRQRTINVVRSGDGFRAQQAERKTTALPTRAAGEIETSLYAAAEAAGVPPAVLAETIRAFSYDVDFQREVRPGDRFEVLYERLVDEGGAWVADGPVLAAALTLSGAKRAVYRHRTAAGHADFFDDKGTSVRKPLLRTPIDGARLTSAYGSRLHPILGYTTRHRGVDFAAPTGTPVYAAGNGVVQFAGADGGYGRSIRIRHDHKFATRYAHLSRFQGGLRPGRRVRQGEIIGYVGSTGLSTGPHLHFEVLVGGGQVNPLKVKMPPAPRLAGAELARFLEARAVADRRLAALAQDERLAKAE